MSNTATKLPDLVDDDKRWSDRFLPEIKSILGQHLISEPAIQEDMYHNTDLVVLKLEAVRVGCRIRRPRNSKGENVFQKYKDEFTIRSDRPSGNKTELAKIIEGWGNFFFYGWADDDEKCLQLWHLCDLNVFRLHFNVFLIENEGKVMGKIRENFDRGEQSSKFRVFQFKQFPPRFVIAKGNK